MNNKLAIKLGALLATCLLCVNVVSGQQATEVYIPIGNSPGISADKSIIGVIRSVDYATHSIDIEIGDGLRTVRVTDDTRYYLDRSRQRQSSSTGAFQDCEKGRTIEVNVSDNDEVEWIKIDVS